MEIESGTSYKRMSLTSKSKKDSVCPLEYFEIQLESDTFSAGQSITGHILIQPHTEIQMAHLTVRLFGQEYVRIMEQSQDGVNYEAKHTVIDQTLELTNNTGMLAGDRQMFEFSFAELHKLCPPSCLNANGGGLAPTFTFVHYLLHAEIDLEDEDSKFTTYYKNRTIFYTGKKVDEASMTPEVKPNNTFASRVQIGAKYFGEVLIDAGLENKQSVYSPGDQVVVNINSITNKSSRKILGLKLSLVRVWRSEIKGKAKEELCHTLATEAFASDCKTMNITIPELLNLSSFRGNLVSVDYYLKVSADLSGMVNGEPDCWIPILFDAVPSAKKVQDADRKEEDHPIVPHAAVVTYNLKTDNIPITKAIAETEFSQKVLNQGKFELYYSWKKSNFTVKSSPSLN